MAAGMIYTIGGSFWEFGGPDLERAKLFVMIGTAEDHHSNPLKIALSKFKRARRALHVDQPGAHRLLGDRRRVGADPARYRRRAAARACQRADRAGVVRPRVPRALHQRRATGGNRPGLAALRAARHRRGRRPDQPALPAEPAVVGPALERPVPDSHPGHRSIPVRRVHPARGRARAPRVPAARRARGRIHARMGRGHHRHSGGNHPPPGARDGGHRARRRRSSCRSRGPTAGATSTPRSSATPLRSMPCAGWRRIRTAFTRCARSRS